MTRWLCIASLLVAMAAVGCGRGDSLMPLQSGKTWSYRVFTRSAHYVEPIRVGIGVSVAGAPGYELTGPMGVSRLAWKGSTLYASRLANARFEPAIPLVAGAEPTKYHGRMEANGTIQPAHAVVTRDRKPMPIQLGGRTFSTVRSQVDLTVGEKQISLQTWFAPGVGIVQQEQREGDVLISQLQLVTE